MKLKIDIFRALLKVVVMALEVSLFLLLIPFWLVAASMQCPSQGDGHRDPRVPRLEVSLPWDAGVE